MFWHRGSKFRPWALNEFPSVTSSGLAVFYYGNDSLLDKKTPTEQTPHPPPTQNCLKRVRFNWFPFLKWLWDALSLSSWSHSMALRGKCRLIRVEVLALLLQTQAKVLYQSLALHLKSSSSDGSLCVSALPPTAACLLTPQTVSSAC